MKSLILSSTLWKFEIKKNLLILNHWVIEKKPNIYLSIKSIQKLLQSFQEFQLTLRTFKFEFFFNPLTKIWMHPSDSLLQLRFKSRSVVLISNALDNVRAPRIWKPFQEISSFSKCLFTYKILYTLDINFLFCGFAWKTNIKCINMILKQYGELIYKMIYFARDQTTKW